MPVLPTEAAPTRDPGQCFLVEQYLSMLPARAQRVLRLRYGLSEENEHPHTTTEIATLLEITSKDVLAIERSAYKRLRKLASGEGKQRRSIHVRKGESYAVRARGYQERLATVYPRMAANGPVNGKHLSKEAHVPERVAYAYLHSRKGDA